MTIVPLVYQRAILFPLGAIIFQVFFKNLGVDIKDVKPTSFLKDRTREIDGNPDFSNKDFGVAQGSQPHMIDELKSENISLDNRAELTTNAADHSKVYSGVTFCKLHKKI